MIYSLLILKRTLEDLFILPFIWLGRMKAKKNPLPNTYEIFFFFPFHHIGGAERVHANITQALKGKKALIIFTRKSQHEGFLNEFKASGHEIMDVSAYTDNKKKYWDNLIYRGLFSAYINAQHKTPVVFNGHSNFAYKLSRWIRNDIPQIELIHSFSSFSYIRVPFLPFYRETVMISKNRIQDHLALYQRWGIPATYHNRIRYILNGIPLPEKKHAREFSENPLKLMYVGRATPEKRVHLCAAISSQLHKAGLPVVMSFVGNVSAALTDPDQHDIFYGDVNDPAIIDDLYRTEADLLFITSSEEGFPMVVMEAMARGSVIIATAVGDLPVHIKHGENGFLFSSVSDENKIVAEGIDFVQRLLKDRDLCRRISRNNLQYAYENFGLATFEQVYRELFESYLH
jgi:glycosyltransferase involved in cell wall biosynthesis